jgi:hypothetical protein
MYMLPVFLCFIVLALRFWGSYTSLSLYPGFGGSYPSGVLCSSSPSSYVSLSALPSSSSPCSYVPLSLYTSSPGSCPPSPWFSCSNISSCSSSSSRIHNPRRLRIPAPRARILRLPRTRTHSSLWWLGSGGVGSWYPSSSVSDGVGREGKQVD